MKVGERGFHLQRLINIRDGRGVKYDTMPKRMFEPAEQGFRKGKVPPADALIKKYYKLREWDERGSPTPQKMAELEI